MSIVGHILDVSVAVLGFFIVSCLMKGRLSAAQKLYLSSAGFLLLWLVAISGMDYTENMAALQVMDAITCACSALLIMTILLISLIFTRNLVQIPRHYWLLYVLPALSSLIVFTNPLHHLFYRQFSTGCFGGRTGIFYCQLSDERQAVSCTEAISFLCRFSSALAGGN